MSAAKEIKDHPAIASEYVKFLATNSGFELLDDLEKRVKETTKVAKDAEGAVASLKTLLNKEDFKEKISKLNGRVNKLEAGKGGRKGEQGKKGEKDDD